MAEIGVLELTYEFDSERAYQLEFTGLDLHDMNVRYTVSTDPGVSPPPVSVASPLMARSIGFGVGRRTVSRKIEASTYAHLRMLVTADVPDVRPVKVGYTVTDWETGQGYMAGCT